MLAPWLVSCLIDAMSIHAALHHITQYAYDRPVLLVRGPSRLLAERPAADLARARQLLEPKIGSITVDDIKSTLRDHFGFPRAIAHGLWTQAREKLPVTTVVLSNRKYQILIGEYFAVGANPGRTAMDMLDLGNPDLDWIRIAQGMGVEAAPTTTLEECADLMSQSFRRPGPFLIELAI